LYQETQGLCCCFYEYILCDVIINIEFLLCEQSVYPVSGLTVYDQPVFAMRTAIQYSMLEYCSSSILAEGRTFAVYRWQR